MMNEQNTGHEGATKDSAPFYIWKSHVADKARCSVEAIEANGTRLRLWYDAGEPVWMAADGMRQLIRGAALAAREVRTVRPRDFVVREETHNGVAGISVYEVRK